MAILNEIGRLMTTELNKKEMAPGIQHRRPSQQIPDPIKSKEFTMNIISPNVRRLWKRAIDFGPVKHGAYVYRHIDNDVLSDGVFCDPKISIYRVCNDKAVGQSLSGHLTHGHSDQRGVGVFDG